LTALEEFMAASRYIVAGLMVASLGCAGEGRDADTAAAAAGDTTATTISTDLPSASGGMVDPNSATKEQLQAAGLTPAAADAVVAGRPYADMVAVDKVVRAQVTDSAARVQLYRTLWKPVDINKASRQELLLIPGVGARMAHEFEEYRPYDRIERFRREIGKYVDSTEVARLEKFVMIP
jgi:DNA uptake protein ComE-like DNA-binding protein